MGIVVRVPVLIIGCFYWWGVFSGYWEAHGPYANNNPDTFINPGVGVLSIIVAVDTWASIRRKSPNSVSQSENSER